MDKYIQELTRQAKQDLINKVSDIDDFTAIRRIRGIVKDYLSMTEEERKEQIELMDMIKVINDNGAIHRLNTMIKACFVQVNKEAAITDQVNSCLSIHSK